MSQREIGVALDRAAEGVQVRQCATCAKGRASHIEPQQLRVVVQVLSPFEVSEQREDRQLVEEGGGVCEIERGVYGITKSNE